ncbi:hypothetical protein WSM22_06560 [Cytophagales bacterium WSM2-2]|nr:hypothetical protein WSM22_06560 [Cytophagales bacterium WSM2-2]
MSFFKTFFGKPKAKTYSDFWTWFQANGRVFYKVVKERGDIEKDFFNKLSPKLEELREGYFYVTGMLNDNTAELVFTAEGKVKNFIFIEELVESAPTITGWKFTAHKPALRIEDVNIDMAGFKFNRENMGFIPKQNPLHPDEIDITVVHPDFTEENKNAVANGVYIFLDNYLGEVNFATAIDNISVEQKKDNMKDFVPISKLKDYLIWREKEFVEKYEGDHHNTENDAYSNFEGRLENGNLAIATVNTGILSWDRKSSHPWILKIDIRYGDSSHHGMPDQATYDLMEEIENEINSQLKDIDGYLNIARETSDGLREIYYACKDFRKPSRVINSVFQKYSGRLQMEYDIYKDKYWRTFDRFVMS